MDNNFTELLKAWLDTPSEERNYAVGALYLLKLSGNRILYSNLVANIDKHKADIEYHLQRYYNFRVQALTHEVVEEMERAVDTIVARHIPLATKADSEPRGRRDDHDSLPAEIQALYTENLSLLRQMREVHLRLRSLSLEESPCPDSERYPFLKELIALDKRLHANWEQYDHYVPTAPAKRSRRR